MIIDTIVVAIEYQDDYKIDLQVYCSHCCLEVS